MTRIRVFFASFLFAINGYAADFSYDYLELGRQTTETQVDFLLTLGYGENYLYVYDVKEDVTSISGSFNVSENFNLLLDWGKGKDNFDLNTRYYDAGVGFHTPIGASTDLVLELLYLGAKVDDDGIDDTGNETGYGASIGIRQALGEKFELDAETFYSDIYDETETDWELGARVNLNEVCSVGAWYSKDSDYTAKGLNFRIAF